MKSCIQTIVNSFPDLPLKNGNCDISRQHGEQDTLLTAIALVARWRIQGNPCFHIPEAAFALIERYLRQRS